MNEYSTAVILAELQVSSTICNVAICHLYFVGHHDIRNVGEDNFMK